MLTMKKAFLLLFASVMMFTACTNENSENPIPLGEATVKGTIYSDMDEDDEDDLPYEAVPAGVTVYVYAVSEAGNTLLGTTTTGADGSYSIALQIGAPTDLYIVVGDFEATINVYDYDEGDYVNKNAIYSEREYAGIDQAVQGVTYIQNIEIDQPEVIDFE